VYAIDSLHNFLRLRRCLEAIHDMDASYHKHFALGFDLASDFSRQTPIARIDLARFQRAPEGSGQSASGGRHDIVQSGCVRLCDFRADAVMFGHGSMDPKDHGFRFGRKISKTKRPYLSLDSDFRNISNVCHRFLQSKRVGA
jgi:hypothetical protein